jgi:hypothetical protein
MLLHCPKRVKQNRKPFFSSISSSKSPDKKGWLAWGGTGWLAKVPWSKEKGLTPTATNDLLAFIWLKSTCHCVSAAENNNHHDAVSTRHCHA